jgi:hypothetical protein
MASGANCTQRDAVEQHGQFLQGRVEGQAALIHLGGDGEHGLHVACLAAHRAAEEMVLPHRAEHVAHAGLLDAAGAVGDGLVEQRKRVAHAAGRALGDVAQRGRLEGHLLGVEDAREVLDDVARASA